MVQNHLIGIFASRNDDEKNMFSDDEKEKEKEKEKKMEKQTERERERESRKESLKFDEKEEGEEEEICESKFLDVQENFDEIENKKEIKRSNTKIINDENAAKFDNLVFLNEKLFRNGNSPNSFKKSNDFKFGTNKIKPKPKISSQIFVKFNIPAISDGKNPIQKR